MTPKQLLRDALQLPILVQLITQVGDIWVVQTVTVLQELVRLIIVCVLSLPGLLLVAGYMNTS